MDLDIISLDFETYYDHEYSLSRMSPAEYILDVRWETIGAGVRRDKVKLPYAPPVTPNPPSARWSEKARWLDGPDLPRLFEKVDWKRTALLSHNVGFDGAILAWRYGIVPALYIDTLGMCRAMLPEAKGASLKKALDHIGAPPKGDAIEQARGKRLADIKRDSAYYRKYTDYAARDCDGSFWLFEHLAHGFAGTAGVGRIHTNEQILLMDMIARMTIVPQFSLDRDVLNAHLKKTQAAKAKLMAVLRNEGILAGDDTEEGKREAKRDLLSNDRYAEVLRKLGVEPPTKISLKTGKETYAFSKVDQEFMALLEDEDPLVQAVVAARLGFKSTLEETRTERFLKIAGLNWPWESKKTVAPELANPLGTGAATSGYIFPPRMPFPLKFSGAHTHRFCLVGHTIICTLRDKRVVWKRLDRLQDADLVWDGEAFVAHGGLARAGVKEVIIYDGVTGTRDHRVWTVEHGYIPLEVAAARGTPIARGAIPDAARIDPSVLWTDSLPHTNPLHMSAMRTGSAQPMEGFARQGCASLPFVRGSEAHGGSQTLGDDAATRRGGEPGRCGTRTALAQDRTCAEGSADAGVGSGAGSPLGAGMDAAGLDACNVGGATRVAAMHEPAEQQFQLLRGERDQVRLRFDGDDGRLASAESWAVSRGKVAGSNQHERTLYAGESPLGHVVRADGEPQFMETWDIVDCGPRNRFMANGRVVHNSGDWLLNLQNLGRDSELRRALIAPAGYKIVAPDASQIEARIVAWLAGCKTLVQAFENKEDVYSTFASSVYNYPVNKVDHPTERFLGKTAVLGLGYGMGAPKFVQTCWVQSKRKVRLEESFGKKVVDVYRSKYHEIPALWKTMETALSVLAFKGASMRIGPLIVHGPSQSIILPDGMRLYYHNLRREFMPIPGKPEQKREQWVFEYGRETKYTFGGKLTENVVQALAKIITMNAATRIRRKARFHESWVPHLAGQIHDQLIYVVPESIADAFRTLVIAEMSARLDWWHDLPLAAEGGVGDNLLEVK